MIAAIRAIIASGEFLRPHRQALLGVALLYALAGCSQGFDYSGTWVGKREVKVPAGADETIYNTFSKVELAIKEDGTFELLESALPKSGRIKISSDSAVLVVEFILGKTVASQGEEVVARNKEIVLRPQDDGSLLFTDPGEFDPKAVKLMRKSKP